MLPWEIVKMVDVSCNIVFCAVLIINSFTLAIGVQCGPRGFPMGGVCNPCWRVCPSYGNDWRTCKQKCPEVFKNKNMKFETTKPSTTQRQLPTTAVTVVENLTSTVTPSNHGTNHTTVQHPVVLSDYTILYAIIIVVIIVLFIVVTGAIIFLVHKLRKPSSRMTRSGHHQKDDETSSDPLTRDTSTMEDESQQSGMCVNFNPNDEQVRSAGPETDDEMLNAVPEFDRSGKPNKDIPESCGDVGDNTSNTPDIPVPALNDDNIADVHRFFGSSHLIPILERVGQQPVSKEMPRSALQKVGQQPMVHDVHQPPTLQRQYSDPVHTIYSTSPVGSHHNNQISTQCPHRTTRRPLFSRQISCPPRVNDMDQIINPYGSDTTRCVNEKGSYDNEAFQRMLVAKFNGYEH